MHGKHEWLYNEGKWDVCDVCGGKRKDVENKPCSNIYKNPMSMEKKAVPRGQLLIFEKKNVKTRTSR